MGNTDKADLSDWRGFKQWQPYPTAVSAATPAEGTRMEADYAD